MNPINLTDEDLAHLSDRFPFADNTIANLIRMLRDLRSMQAEDELIARVSIGFEIVLTRTLWYLLEDEGVVIDGKLHLDTRKPQLTPGLQPLGD